MEQLRLKREQAKATGAIDLYKWTDNLVASTKEEYNAACKEVAKGNRLAKNLPHTAILTGHSAYYGSSVAEEWAGGAASQIKEYLEEDEGMEEQHR